MKRKALVLLVLTLLTACDDKPAVQEKGFAGLADDASSYAQVTPGKVFVFPQDHGAHDDFRIEWWYVTANLTDAQGQHFGVQWTLFRNALPRDKSQQHNDQGWNNRNLWLGHAAVSSATEHYATERYARGGVDQAGVRVAPFSAWIDDWSLTSLSRPMSDQAAGQEAGQESAPASSAVDPLTDMQLQAAGPQFSYRLHLSANRPLVLQGDQGFSQKSEQGQASYYYSQPFFQAEGSLVIDGKTYQVSGPAWLDREWSSQPLTANQTGWDWFSLHLKDGAQVMLYRMRQKHGAPYVTGTWINADGSTELLASSDISLMPQGTSTVAGRDIPTRWSVKIPAKGVDVITTALNPKAWMNLRIPYWEGPINLSGSEQGVGYLEMTGY